MINVYNESLICHCDGAEILRPWLFVVVCEHTSIHDDILSTSCCILLVLDVEGGVIKCESTKVNMYKMRKWDNAKVCIKCRSGYGFRLDGTQEIYLRVPSKTTPTTILVAVIKAHPNRKTNLNDKTNPNPDLQKTCKKKLKEKRKKIIACTGFESVTLDSISTIRTLYH